MQPKTKVLSKVEVKRSLSEQAYQQLEEAIVTLELAPGLVVSEQALSEMTQIGRTPIREAIQRLARENLITVLPQRGILVAEMDVQQQLKLLETRREIERLICRSAARRATPAEREQFARLAQEFADEAREGDDARFMRSDREFNELCLTAARNEFAEGAMRLMHGLSRRFSITTISIPPIFLALHGTMRRLHTILLKVMKLKRLRPLTPCWMRLKPSLDQHLIADKNRHF